MAEDLVSLGSVHGSVSGTCVPPRWPGLRVSVLPRWWPGSPSPAASSLTRLLPQALVVADSPATVVDAPASLCNIAGFRRAAFGPRRLGTRAKGCSGGTELPVRT